MTDYWLAFTIVGVGSVFNLVVAFLMWRIAKQMQPRECVLRPDAPLSARDVDP